MSCQKSEIWQVIYIYLIFTEMIKKNGYSNPYFYQKKKSVWSDSIVCFSNLLQIKFANHGWCLLLMIDMLKARNLAWKNIWNEHKNDLSQFWFIYKYFTLFLLPWVLEMMRVASVEQKRCDMLLLYGSPVPSILASACSCNVLDILPESCVWMGFFSCCIFVVCVFVWEQATVQSCSNSTFYPSALQKYNNIQRNKEWQYSIIDTDDIAAKSHCPFAFFLSWHIGHLCRFLMRDNARQRYSMWIHLWTYLCFEHYGSPYKNS